MGSKRQVELTGVVKMSQVPSNLQLNWRQGRTNDFKGTLYQDAALTTPVDITGVRWILEVRAGSVESQAPVLLRKDSSISGNMTIDADAGEIVIHIPPTNTLGVTWKEAQYEIVGIWPTTNATHVYWTGKVTLTAAVASVTT